MCCKEYKKLYPSAENCFEPKTSAEEKGKSFRIECTDKTERFCRVHIDNCLIVKNDSIKCDYAFTRCSNKELYYVEFKDTDIIEAYNQIVNTIINHFPSPKEKNFGFIIATRITTASNRIIARKKEEFKKMYGQDLLVKSKKYTHIVK